jgi:hypothetical protein
MPLLLKEGICESLDSHIVLKLTKSDSNAIQTVVQFLALDLSKLRFLSKFHKIDFKVLFIH